MQTEQFVTKYRTDIVQNEHGFFALVWCQRPHEREFCRFRSKPFSTREEAALFLDDLMESGINEAHRQAGIR